MAADDERSALAERLAAVHREIAQAADRAGRDAADVLLVAVTKTVPLERIRRAVEAGATDLGENRVQEAETKIPALGASPGPRWHLIGHLQTNKTGKALDLFDVIHSVDSLALAQTLSRRLVALGRTKPLDVLLEVNVAGEATKRGFAPDGVFADGPAIAALPGLRLRGLMTVAPLVTDPEEVRPVFRELHQLRGRLSDRLGGEPLPDLSMGMSHDFPVAVEEGATMVRVGTAIFGPRPA